MNRLSLKLNLHIWLKVLTNNDCWDVYPVIISNKCWCHDRFVVQDRQNRTWGFTVKTWLAHAEVMVDPALPVESFFLYHHSTNTRDEASLVNSVLSYGGVSTELTCCFVAEVCVYLSLWKYVLFTTIWKTNKSRIVCI